MKLAGQHLLAPVDKATLAAVPSADSSPAGNWVGVTARISALVYNTNGTQAVPAPHVRDGPGQSAMGRQAGYRSR